jgi:integrase
VSPTVTIPSYPHPGELRDPSSTQGALGEGLVWCGLPWVTSHIFGKTTIPVLDNAGPSARAIADQLGHAQPSVTPHVHMGRKIASTEAARVLEQLA